VGHLLGDDGLPLLSTIALRAQGDVREAAVLRLDDGVIRSEWSGVVDGMSRAAEALRGWGVISRDLLPYRAMLPVLSAVLTEDPNTDRSRLERWFWGRSFGKVFDVAANTKAVGEYRQLLASRGDLAAPSANADDIWLATRKTDGALYRAFVCALVSQLGLNEIVRAPSVDFDRDPFKDVASVVHIFGPSAFPNDDPPIHLRVLNVALHVASRNNPRGEGVLTAEPRSSLDRQFLRGFPRSYQGSWYDLFRDRLRQLGAFLEARAGQQLEEGVDTLRLRLD
jgi:hypothetical protein